MIVIKAKFSKILEKTENPEETLDYAYEKQLESLQRVKKGIADVVTAKKRMEMQRSRLQEGIVKMESQARQALKLGQEDLARQALERKALAITQFADLDTQIADLQAQQDKLISSERNLRVKIESFRTRKEVIKAQYRAAEAQVRISEAATGVGAEFANIGQAVQRATDKTEEMRARADAMGELEAAGTFDDVLALGAGTDSIDRELAKVSSDGMVNADLSRMKSELGIAAPAEIPELQVAPATEPQQ